ncbi:hypothetical protein BT96DRAFT_937134 [Gymnopus androsaceus JB14]|uniref:Uncharacterized protein n=1 Tax=Gymnopus androsaceus JB14 TaxID=1447944 RepID=A0A6A4HZT9_9AGAR|nr:hypothetical protein BT96DRAFT_937134 [Gymnopus androsaceus JB14]
MPAVSDVWNYIHKDYRQYKNNQSHKQSLCKFCIGKAVDSLVAQDNTALSEGQILQRQDSGEIEKIILDTVFSGSEEVRVFGIYEARILKGQPDFLWKDLSRCPHAST